MLIPPQWQVVVRAVVVVLVVGVGDVGGAGGLGASAIARDIERKFRATSMGLKIVRGLGNYFFSG